MTDYALDINNLSKNYYAKSGAVSALDSVSLKIKSGSIFGLLGPNGAGKSTLINILATSVIKTAGTIKVCGVDFDQELALCKMKLGIVPQEIVIDPFFSVREALELYAGFYGVRKQDRITQELLDALGLSDKADSKPRSLSGGMKRRLLIAKALVHQPEILILDEPTAGVDVDLRVKLWDYVRQLNKQGTTIILTTHYLEEAEELCDEIAFINHGRIIVCDKTQNLINDFGVRELLLTVTGANNIALAELKRLNSEVVITHHGKTSTISMKYKHAQIALNEILGFCTAGNINIIDIKTKESDLESIFKLLMKP